MMATNDSIRETLYLLLATAPKLRLKGRHNGIQYWTIRCPYRPLEAHDLEALASGVSLEQILELRRDWFEAELFSNIADKLVENSPSAVGVSRELLIEKWIKPSVRVRRYPVGLFLKRDSERLAAEKKKGSGTAKAEAPVRIIRPEPEFKPEKRYITMADKNMRVEYTVEKKIAVLSTSAKGWTKELRTIKWGDNPAKYDVRDWAPNDEKMGKGVTFSKDELTALNKAIASELKGAK